MNGEYTIQDYIGFIKNERFDKLSPVAFDKIIDYYLIDKNTNLDDCLKPFQREDYRILDANFKALFTCEFASIAKPICKYLNQKFPVCKTEIIGEVIKLTSTIYIPKYNIRVIEEIGCGSEMMTDHGIEKRFISQLDAVVQSGGQIISITRDTSEYKKAYVVELK